jgi:hypothetical protein
VTKSEKSRLPIGTEWFRAAIKKQGLNPYVDVPDVVSRALVDSKRSGRISYEGSLEGVPIRGTLMPTKGGRHRLYINAGMRSAAGVDAGDTVTVELRAVSPDAFRPPADVEALLDRAGALDVFADLAPSHRREILRYIDDARTPTNRRKRIGRTADDLLGRSTTKRRPRDDGPLWTCPRCGNSFVTRNQYHSCARHDLSEPFAGKPGEIRILFDLFREVVERCGPVSLVVYRDRVAFMVRVRFAGAVPRRRWLEIGLWLPHRVEDARFHKIEAIAPMVHIHQLRVAKPENLDDDVAEWTREAYVVGAHRASAK